MRDVIFGSVVVICLGIAIWRTGRVHATREEATMNDDAARSAYFDVTEKEPEERRAAAQRFQGAPWSQQDEFHSRERKTMRAWAESRHVNLSAVVNALDRGMREAWPTSPNAVVVQKVIPCRPRLTY